MCQDLRMSAREMYRYEVERLQRRGLCYSGRPGRLGCTCPVKPRWCFSELQRLDMEVQGSVFAMLSFSHALA